MRICFFNGLFINHENRSPFEVFLINGKRLVIRIEIPGATGTLRALFFSPRLRVRQGRTAQKPDQLRQHYNTHPETRSRRRPDQHRRHFHTFRAYTKKGSYHSRRETLAERYSRIHSVHNMQPTHTRTSALFQRNVGCIVQLSPHPTRFWELS